MDLLGALRRPEGKTLEFKRDLSSPDSLLRTVVAFANTAGGIVLVGVEDGTRHVRGVAEPLALEERLASLISDSITPRLLPDLEVLSYRKTHVVAVQVFPSPTRPHHLTKAGQHAGTYVRVGSTNRRADDALIAEMQRFAQGEAFDERAMPELDSEAIDFRAASESFPPVRRLSRRDLVTLRLRLSLLFSRQGADPLQRRWLSLELEPRLARMLEIDFPKEQLPGQRRRTGDYGIRLFRGPNARGNAAVRRFNRHAFAPIADFDAHGRLTGSTIGQVESRRQHQPVGKKDVVLCRRLEQRRAPPAERSDDWLESFTARGERINGRGRRGR